MKYLPFEDFEIHTSLTSDEVFYRLRAAVDTKGTWSILANKRFRGHVSRDYFWMRRYTWWNRNFTPVISGKIQAEDSGSSIRIKMRMPWFSFLFYAFILGWLWIMYFSNIANLLVQRIQTGAWQIDSPWLFLPGIFMFAFAYFISVGSFFGDVHYVKEVLFSLSDVDGESIVYHDKILGITESQILRTIFVVTIVVSVGWIVFSFVR
ncbi:MAG: hypothetical protein IPP66_08825 [Anaerolineales bacterium]|nr:hypothetical protein [Anaerolineales bacterium]